MAKLTLDIDDKIVARSEQYAKQTGLSVSKLVEDYLDLLSQGEHRHDDDPPVLKALRGVLQGGSGRDYQHELVEKYTK